MFASLLVPLDGTPEAGAALPLARTLARTTGARISLLHVRPTSLLLPPPAPPPGTERAGEDRPLAYLSGVADDLRSIGLGVDVVVREGDVADEILAEAREGKADLVVMATHGRAGIGRLVLGSVAEDVLAHSPVPVALQPLSGHHGGRLRTLLVPVDGSPGGLLALGTAVGLARAGGAHIELLRVAVPFPLWIYEPTLGLNTGPLLDPAWNAAAEARDAAYVRGIARRLRRVGIPARGTAVVGTVPQAIGMAADELDADLIVMSTHALTGPVRALVGSVADAVVRSARRPVLLVRRGMQPQRAGANGQVGAETAWSSRGDEASSHAADVPRGAEPREQASSGAIPPSMAAGGPPSRVDGA